MGQRVGAGINAVKHRITTTTWLRFSVILIVIGYPNTTFAEDRSGSLEYPEIVQAEPLAIPTRPRLYTNLNSTESPPPHSMVIAEIYFDEDRYLITGEAASLLQEIVLLLDSHKHWSLEIETGCDTRGNGAYNLALSEMRTRTVEDFVLTLGLEGERVRTVNYGYGGPLCRSGIDGCLKNPSHLQLTFNVLAPGQTYIGCLARLKLESIDHDSRNQKEALGNPIFLNSLRLAQPPPHKAL